MMNVLLLMTVSGVISPTSAPSSTRQYLGSPSHPASVLPSKMGLKPGSSPVGGSGRSDCFGTYCAASRAAASAPRKTRRLLFDIVSYVISQKNRRCIICGYPYYYPSDNAAAVFLHYLWLSILLSISFIACRDDFHAAAPNRGAASQAAASRLIGTLRPVCGLPLCAHRRPIQF